MDSGITVTSVTTPAGPLHVAVHGVGEGVGTTPYPRIVRADTAATAEACAGTDARADLAPEAGAAAAATAGPGVESTVEAAVRTPGAAPGTVLPATVRVTTPDGRPHFWDAPPKPGGAERGWECTGVPAFTLIPFHLQQARDDPAYRFAELPPGGHVTFPLTVEPAAAAPPGEHLARILATTPVGTFEDVLTVTVAPGGRALVRARIGSTGIRTPLTGQAYAVSPFGTWEPTAPAVLPVEVPPDGETQAVFELRPPPGTPAGEYWIVVKAVCQGRIAYGPAIAVHVSEG